MFDLTTIQLMNEAALQRSMVGKPVRNAIDGRVVRDMSASVKELLADETFESYIEALDLISRT